MIDQNFGIGYHPGENCYRRTTSSIDAERCNGIIQGANNSSAYCPVCDWNKRRGEITATFQWVEIKHWDLDDPEDELDGIDVSLYPKDGEWILVIADNYHGIAFYDELHDCFYDNVGDRVRYARKYMRFMPQLMPEVKL
jgi:hypothetical protein